MSTELTCDRHFIDSLNKKLSNKWTKMNKSEIIQQLEVVFNDVLDKENIALTEATSADDLEGWDSLSHLQLIVAIEKQFKIKFTSKEILSWKNVGELVNSIMQKK